MEFEVIYETVKPSAEAEELIQQGKLSFSESDTVDFGDGEDREITRYTGQISKSELFSLPLSYEGEGTMVSIHGLRPAFVFGSYTRHEYAVVTPILKKVYNKPVLDRFYRRVADLLFMEAL